MEPSELLRRLVAELERLGLPYDGGTIIPSRALPATVPRTSHPMWITQCRTDPPRRCSHR